MQIVVLDGYTLNPGDLSWAELEQLGKCKIYDRTPAEEVVQRCQGARVALTNKTVIDNQIMEQLPQLKYIGVLATGYNVVDTEVARQRGIVVTNVPTYGTDSVAQMVFAHLLNLTQHVSEHAESVRKGEWAESQDFCYWKFPLVELSGLTMGLVGLGRIGAATAKIAQAFGMRVIGHDVAQFDIDGVEQVDVSHLFAESDVVSLHCPLTDDNEGFVNRSLLGSMKEGAFLINTSRGPLIDEAALAEALNAGKLAGAGLDVLSTEPPKPDNPLLTAKNCYITPHIAWATRAARNRLMEIACHNICAFTKGEKVNVINF